MNYNYTEQEHRWAREVLYLHSLWHQGPPNPNRNFSSPHIPRHDHHPTFHPNTSFSNPNPYSHPNPNPYSHPNPNPSFYYANPSSSHRTRDSSQEKEWPLDPASVAEQSSPHTWPQFEQAVQNPAVSPNSAARGALISKQLSAIQSCKGFFSQDSDSESECESGSEDDVDEFFTGLFENDVGLRGCYQNNSENGEFYCLVCEARKGGNKGKGKGKMYRGCAALAQHASAIRNVGWRIAHRAFARSICRVLGWDPQRLPSIVLLPGSVVKAHNSEV